MTTPTLEQTLADKVRALFTTFQGVFKKSMDSASVPVNEVVTRVPSKSANNTYAWLLQLPSFKRWTGERTRKRVKTAAYVVDNEDWEMTIEIPKNSVDDDTVGVYQPIVESMANEAAGHDAEVLAEIISKGFTSEGLCFDGQPFFSTAHPLEFNEKGVPVVGGETFSNLMTDPDNPTAPYYVVACCSRAVRPFLIQDRSAPVLISRTALTDERVYEAKMFEFAIDKRQGAGYTLPQLAVASNLPLTKENFEKIRARILSMVGADGKKNMGLDVTHIIFGSDYVAAAEDLFTVPFNAAGATNKFYNKVKLLRLPTLDAVFDAEEEEGGGA